MSNIYEEAIADAKRLRQKAREDAHRQIMEQFAPKVERYIEQALLEDDGEDDDENILTDIEMAADEYGAAAAGDGQDDGVASDVEAGIEDEAAGNEVGDAGGISMNSDGTWTLDLDDVVVPEEEGVEEVEPGAAPADVAAPAIDDAAEALSDGDVKESLDKLRSIMKIAEAVENKEAAYSKLVGAFAKLSETLTVNKKNISRSEVAGLTTLASFINESYMILKENPEVEKTIREGLCSKLEGTYGTVNEALGTAVCSRISKQVSLYEHNVKSLRKLNETSRNKKGKVLSTKIEGLGRVLEAVVDRTNPGTARKLKTRMATLMKEINKMTTKRRGKLQEMEDVVLKLSFDEDEDAQDLKAALGGDDLGGDDLGGDEDLDALLGDEGEDEGGDDLDFDMDMEEGQFYEGDEADEDDEALDEDDDKMDEATIASRLSRLFEDDDEDEGGEDIDLGDGGDDEGDDEGDDDLDFGDDEGGGEGDSEAASALEKVVSALESGDVSIEIVDDEAAMGDELGGMDDLGDELGGEFGEDDEDVVDIDMEDVAEAVRDAVRGGRSRLREMDTGYHDHPEPGPGEGVKDFGDADEDGEAFTDSTDADVIDESRARMRARAKARRSRNRVSEGRKARRSAEPTAREVAKLRRTLAESKQKQAESSLLAAKLLYTNRILTMEELSRSQKERITDAIDEARNLREAQLLYRNLTRSLKRKSRRLSEGRHRPIGSASQVSTSGGASRKRFDKAGAVQTGNGSNGGSPLLNESIDLDLWKRHAGLD